MPAFAAYRKDHLVYVGLHEDEDDCWRVFLGWPSLEEIAIAKKRGTVVKRVMITPYYEPGLKFAGAPSTIS